MKDPVSLLGKATIGTIRSSSFLSVFVMIYQGRSFLVSARARTNSSLSMSAWQVCSVLVHKRWKASLAKFRPG